jgi:hypothetical protein
MTEDQLTEILNRELAKFAGQMFQHFDERLDKLETEMVNGSTELSTLLLNILIPMTLSVQR